MDFSLTDEQRLIQDTVRAFVDERVLPVAIENDIAHRLDMSLIEGMAELGLLGIVIPEEYGGAGLDFVAEALSCEEIERGEAAFRTLISVHVGLNSLSLLRYATEEQKQRWLVPQARGEKLACFGLTEPAAGSDVASMLSTARREGDVYVLNGQKNWISYATVADHALVFAKTDPKAKHKGISAFVLEKGMRGFTSRETEHKLGVWAGSTGELFFENVEVPAENLIGEEGQGFEIAMYSLDQGRFTVAAGACGVIRACLERSVEYARERETFGEPIGKYQFVQDMIADMILGYETSKLLVMQAAWMKNEGLRNTRETSLAKWHATESGVPRCAPGDPGARRLRVQRRVRDRALLPQRAGADHLRGHDADPQADAGRARARLPPAERARRRRLADRVLGAGAPRPGARRHRSSPAASNGCNGVRCEMIAPCPTATTSSAPRPRGTQGRRQSRVPARRSCAAGRLGPLKGDTSRSSGSTVEEAEENLDKIKDCLEREGAHGPRPRRARRRRGVRAHRRGRDSPCPTATTSPVRPRPGQARA